MISDYVGAAVIFSPVVAFIVTGIAANIKDRKTRSKY